MIKIPTKKDDMLEIYEDNGKYILKYPTFNITMPEVTQEISKESVDSYLRGEHTGEELIMQLPGSGNPLLIRGMPLDSILLNILKIFWLISNTINNIFQILNLVIFLKISV